MVEDICNRSSKITQGLCDDRRRTREAFREQKHGRQQLTTQSSVSFALSGLRLTRNPKTWCPTDFSFAEKSRMAKSGEAIEERCLVGIHSMTEIKVQSHGSM